MDVEICLFAQPWLLSRSISKDSMKEEIPRVREFRRESSSPADTEESGSSEVEHSNIDGRPTFQKACIATHFIVHGPSVFMCLCLGVRGATWVQRSLLF